MTTEKVSDLEVVNLAEYFNPKYFRLVTADAAHVPGGISEVPVYMNLHSDFAKHLRFNINNLQSLFGFAIMGEKLREINKSNYYSQARNGTLKHVELNDCGKLWIMKFEFFDETKKLYAVKMEEMVPLLNRCRKPILNWQ